MYREAMRINHKLGDPVWTGVNLLGLAYGLALHGEPSLAARLLAKAMTLFDEIGSRFDFSRDWNEKARTAIREQIDEAAFEEAWRQGESMTLDEAVALAISSVA
jgi:hypothetical protein